jgi:hypothetical protein
MKNRIVALFILATSLSAIPACVGVEKKPTKEGVLSGEQKGNKLSKSSVNENIPQQTDKVLLKAAKDFKESLVKKESLSAYMNDNWTFVYHSDGRCEGSTDGSIQGLKQKQIDKKIKIKVTNDGDGWDCEKKEPSTYELDFLLKQTYDEWENFNLTPSAKEEKTIYIENGDNYSYYLILRYSVLDGKYLITKLEFHNEDPG